MYFWNWNIYCIFWNACICIYLLVYIGVGPFVFEFVIVRLNILEGIVWLRPIWSNPQAFFLSLLISPNFGQLPTFLFGIRIWTYSYFDILFCVNLSLLFSIETRMCYLKLVEYNLSGLILHQCYCQMQSWNQVIVCNSKDRWTNCEDYPHTALEDPDLNLWKEWREYF